MFTHSHFSTRLSLHFHRLQTIYTTPVNPHTKTSRNPYARPKISICLVLKFCPICVQFNSHPPQGDAFAVNAFKVRPIEDWNEITFHFLECVFVTQHFKALDDGVVSRYTILCTNLTKFGPIRQFDNLTDTPSKSGFPFFFIALALSSFNEYACIVAVSFIIF